MKEIRKRGYVTDTNTTYLRFGNSGVSVLRQTDLGPLLAGIRRHAVAAPTKFVILFWFEVGREGLGSGRVSAAFSDFGRHCFEFHAP